MYVSVLSPPYVCADNIYFRERDVHSVKRMISYMISLFAILVISLRGHDIGSDCSISWSLLILYLL